MDEANVTRLLKERAAATREAIPAKCLTEQRHLDEGTAERAYWHYGYYAALCDVIGLSERSEAPVSQQGG